MERGLNAAEHCRTTYIFGRHQVPVRALEEQARGLCINDPEPFVSVLNENGEGTLPTYYRRQPMRDGTSVLMPVASHPNPVVRLLLEQGREAGIVQASDRHRSVWVPPGDPSKITILHTNV